MLTFQKRIRDWAASPETMVWEQLSVNKPHLAYLIIGGFTSLFMLCSLFVKERLYIGEATVATLCGVIFGPHAANAFNPLTWGNTDQITLECSRVVLVVQCFAVGVELPKAYMERHWKSVIFLLVPVMTFGWLTTSLFIWWMIEPLSWLESLMCAACVTATDPVLASSVVGKGKFAKRVPKHLRDLLSAESGCNDGMAFPFIYLSFYLIHYKLDAAQVTFHWFCNTILYECIFGCFYGVMIGYLGRHAIRWADRRDLIDRESFLVFYFVLALFAAGTGATLGTDDLLVGFAAGVGFSNDGWFTEKTEESHVSNVIDLLLNLAYFVYLGSIIPWEQYNNPVIGLTPWKLVVIAIFVILFRRIPIVMALKPFIPDVKTWREALFAGHFGPIGVGAIFAAILARAELETDTTEPLAVVPTDPDSENWAVVQIIWPLTTFLVITSILVHGSSIAVFTLGKRINSFTLTMSYTQANEEGPTWMNRLPRIASTAKTMSKGKDDFSAASSMEKMTDDYPPGQLPPPGGLPHNFLRRQKEEETPIEKPKATRRKSRWDAGMGPGGPIEQSAITPLRRSDHLSPAESASDTLNEKSESQSSSYNVGDNEDVNEPPDQLEMEDAQEKRDKKKKQQPQHVEEPELEVFDEGDDMIVEDEEGETVGVHNVRGESDAERHQHIMDDERILRSGSGKDHAKGKFHPHTRDEGEEFEEKVGQGLGHPEQTGRNLLKKWGKWEGFHWKGKDNAKASESKPSSESDRKNGVPARAYQFGQTLIVEDEDGEVLKKIDLTKNDPGRGGRGGMQNTPGMDTTQMRQGLKRMGTWAGLGGRNDEVDNTGEEAGEPSNVGKNRKKSVVDTDDDRIRFTVGTGGRRMSKQEFIQQLHQMDPKSRRDMIDDSDVPDAVKEDVHAKATAEEKERKASTASQSRPTDGQRRRSSRPMDLSALPEQEAIDADMPLVRRLSTNDEAPKGDDNLVMVDSNDNTIPFHDVTQSIQRVAGGREETAAQKRRRFALRRKDSDDDGTERVPPAASSSSTGTTTTTTADRRAALSQQRQKQQQQQQDGETQAERRRRMAALGEGGVQDDSDSEDDGQERHPERAGHRPVSEPTINTNINTNTAGTGSSSSRGTPKSPGIRFADSPSVSQGRMIQWGEGVGGKNGNGGGNGNGNGNGKGKK